MIPPSRVRARGGTPVLALALALAGCGGSDADSADMRVDDDAAMDTTPAGTPAPPTLETLGREGQRHIRVTLTDSTVVPDEDLLPAGEVTFEIVNTGSHPRALALEGAEVRQRSEPVAPGGTGSLTVVLETGTYHLVSPDRAGRDADTPQRMSVPVVVR